MHRLLGIALGLIGMLLWFMPLGEFHVSAMKLTMSTTGRTAAVLTPLTYGVPVSMLLFSASAYLSRSLLQVAFAITGAICAAAVYGKLGGGYTPAFLALSVASALCVVLSIANAARSYRSSVGGASDA